MTGRTALLSRVLRAASLSGFCLALAVPPAAGATAEHGSRPATTSLPAAPAPGAPALRVTTAQAGLEIPWDLSFLPNGAMLYTQRDRRQVVLRATNGDRRLIVNAPGHVWASGETGMMAVLVERGFATRRTFLTCHGSTASGSPDVRVVRWKLNADRDQARVVRNLVTGLPATSGRHGGCRLRFGNEGALYIGTGDAADERHAQSLTSGGGKVLRVRPATGAGWPTNRWSGSSNAMKRRVFTYGHRNVQGLALRADGRMWSVEHGTHRDDEVNVLRNGGNYGWQAGPGYDESRPMTDHDLPGVQIGARWRSGEPTIAPSGATWLRGAKWGSWRGALAMAVLGSEELLILKFDSSGKLLRTFKPAVLDGDAGRLRSAVLGPRNNLLLTTSNGVDDRILRVSPRG
jgi:glucose/arabinose dehydrogenase